MQNQAVNGNGIADAIPTTVISLRLPADDKAKLEEKAKMAGLALSDWAKETLLGTPAYNPETQELRQVLLEQTIEHYLTEGAKQYADFLKAAEMLFAPLAQQMANHREWMKGMLTGFSGDVAQQIGKVTAAIAQQDQRIATGLKEADRRFYARWIYVCLAAFLAAAVSGFAFGYWRP